MRAERHIDVPESPPRQPQSEESRPREQRSAGCANTQGLRPNLMDAWMLKRLHEIEEELRKVQATIASIDLETLHDKGQKLLLRAKGLCACVDEKQREELLMRGLEKLSLHECGVWRRPATRLPSPRRPDAPAEKKPEAPVEKEPAAGAARQSRETPTAEQDTHPVDRLFDEIARAERAFATERRDLPELRTKLMEHQAVALRWMSLREACFPFGGILADDMGLGKTLTVLAHIVARRGGPTPLATLVIVPTSVLHQWEDEVGRHCARGQLTSLLYHGIGRFRHDARLPQVDLVLTSYGTFAAESSVVLRRTVWRRVVLDEAHTIRNHRCSSSVAVLDARAKFRWALSGTPIHNALGDLFSLVKFLRLAPLDDHRVWRLYLERHPNRDEILRKLVATLVLRRTKRDLDPSGRPVVSLPAKRDLLHHLTLSAEERREYDRLSATLRKTAASYFRRGRVPGAGEPSFMHVIVVLLRLQQACCHPHLLCGATDRFAAPPPEPAAEDRSPMDQLAAGLDALTLGAPAADAVGPAPPRGFGVRFVSSKVGRLLSLLKTITRTNQADATCGGLKCVVVSQWTGFLGIIQWHLTAAGYTCGLLCGSVQAAERQALATSFNAQPHPEVLLLSLKAGGVGLNLMGANCLFLMDQHCNPALEQQACDRIYRLGQTRPVTIHKFVVEDSIEVRIEELQRRKLKLASDILSSSRRGAAQFSLEDVRYLLNIPG